jgi:hypothetical protein
VYDIRRASIVELRTCSGCEVIRFPHGKSQDSRNVFKSSFSIDFTVSSAPI